jgi:hypothetical protein
MAAAVDEYERWLRDRKFNRGITIYSRKSLDKEE